MIPSSVRTLFTCLLASCASAVFAAPPVPRYDLVLRIEPAQRRLDEEATVTLAPGASKVSVLRLALAEQMTDVKAEIVSPKECAGPAAVQKLPSQFGLGIWSVTPAQPIPANTEIKCKVSFHGGDKTAFVFHIGPDGCFAGGGNTAWYPMFETPGASGSELGRGSPRAVGHIRMIVPEGITAMACGAKVGQSKDGDHEVFDYQVDSPCALSFAAAKFFVHRVEGGIPVTVYFFKDRPNVQDYVRGCRRVIEELTKIYGKFPFAEFAVVEVNDDSASDAGFSGASLPGFILANGSFLNAPFNLAYFGHEIGHCWWGNAVSTKGIQGGYMLSEGMAQYGSLRVVRAVDGPEMAERYRRTGYPGYIKEQCGNGYLAVEVSGHDEPLASMHGGYAHLLADCKGFLVLDQLERVIGRQAMDVALRDIVSKHWFGSVSWDEFKEEFRNQAHTDLTWFWKQWTERVGAPVLSVDWKQTGGAVSGTLSQQGEPYRLRVPIQIRFEDGRAEVREVELTGASVPFAYNVHGQVASVEADPAFEILHNTPQTAAYWNDRKPMLELLYLMRNKPEDAKTAAQQAISSAGSVDSTGIQFAAHFALGVLAQPTDAATARKEYELALACPVRSDLLVARCYLRLANVCLKLGDKDRAAWAARCVIGYEKAIGDSDYTSDAETLLKQMDG